MQNAEVVTYKHNQRSKGFAFVQMLTVEEAKRAVERIARQGIPWPQTGRERGEIERASRTQEINEQSNSLAFLKPEDSSLAVSPVSFLLWMSRFFIVGPTAAENLISPQKSQSKLGAEIVGADAFQIYRGLDLLTAKPDRRDARESAAPFGRRCSVNEEMNAEKFRRLALEAIAEDSERAEKRAIVVGGSGLYIKALTHGFTPLPAANRKLREQLSQFSARRIVHSRSATLDPNARRRSTGKIHDA